MLLHFYKYEGAGNDFIIIDNRKANIVLDKENIVFLCLRHFGIGADGLMFLETPDRESEYFSNNGKNVRADFAMRFFNPDATSEMMCGNGGRCMVKFAFDIGAIQNNVTTFLAPDGIHEAEILPNGDIAIEMRDVGDFEHYTEGIWCNTGASHFVVQSENLQKEDVFNRGRMLRYDSRFDKYKGTNVNFYSVKSQNHLLVRTYERGVENETLACGTGMVATALCHALKTNIKDGEGLINVSTRYNDLQVKFLKTKNIFTDVYLIGPSKKVFEGDIVV